MHLRKYKHFPPLCCHLSNYISINPDFSLEKSARRADPKFSTPSAGKIWPVPVRVKDRGYLKAVA